MECMGWHMETHHGNSNQEHFLHCVILQGETVIWSFQTLPSILEKPINCIPVLPTWMDNLGMITGGIIEDPCSDSTELVEVKLQGMRSLSRFKHG